MDTVTVLIVNWLLVSLAATAAWIAVKQAQRAAEHAQRLHSIRARVLEMESALEGLSASHRKLQGKFYGTLGAARAAAEEERETRGPLTAFEGTGLQVCDNWAESQRTGPHSVAGQCVCEYCEYMRSQRRATKAALMPKGQAARIQSMKDGLNQP